MDDLVLQKLTGTDEEDISDVEEKLDLIETDYRLLLVKLSDTLSKVKETSSAERNSLLDYYTMWVHQIKTPIAAISLIIQNMEDEETANRLRSQLLHVENYADMALNYLRLGSESNDLHFEKVNVDEVLRAEIRRAMTMICRVSLKKDIQAITDITRRSPRDWVCIWSKRQPTCSRARCFSIPRSEKVRR